MKTVKEAARALLAQTREDANISCSAAEDARRIDEAIADARLHPELREAADAFGSLDDAQIDAALATLKRHAR